MTTTATIVSSAADPVPSDNSASTTTTVIGFNSLSAIKTVNAPRAFETTDVRYTIVVSNPGPASQNDNPGDEFVDQLLSGLTLKSATATSGTVQADLVANTVHWNGSISAGASMTITITATVNLGTAGSTISNVATLHFDRDHDGINESTGQSSAPGGGATTFVSDPVSQIPTASEWTLLLIALALGAVGALMIGRRN